MFQDARDLQILFLASFLVLGIGTRDWTLRPELVLVAIATCLATQALAATYWPRQPQPSISETETPVIPLPLSLRSALITALGLSLLLRVDHWYTMAIASILAILSKFMFQVRHKHFFNPANFGIIAVLLFTQDAWVSPGQWGDESWYGLVFAGTGGVVLKRVGRWDTTAAFLLTYGLLEAMRNLWLGWTWDVSLHRLMSGSLLLFALFMLTDPRSIPDAPISRIIWASCIASLSFILRNQFFLSTSVFWALFALSPLSILLDWIWSAPRFFWQQPSTDLASLNG